MGSPVSDGCERIQGISVAMSTLEETFHTGDKSPVDSVFSQNSDSSNYSTASSETITPVKYYELRDPGVLPAIALPSNDEYRNEYTIHLETDRTLHRNVSPLQVGHNRTTSDSVLFANERDRTPRRSIGGLSRKKAVIYRNVPLVFQDFVTGPPTPKDDTECSRLRKSITERLAAYDPVININGEMSDSEDGFCEFVCGLPCTSRRREEELLTTLDILMGIKTEDIKEGDEKKN